MFNPQCARVPTLGLNPHHAPKALAEHSMIPDGLFGRYPADWSLGGSPDADFGEPR